MSVNHCLLPVTDDELDSILELPERIRDVAEQRAGDVVELGEDGVAIVALTAESGEDPLAFMRAGAPDDVCDWVGRYVEADGRVVECEVDMGYGPASYYRNSFLLEVAERLEPMTAEAFAEECDLDWLEENSIYPSGWHDEGRLETLIESFNIYRICVLDAAKNGHHLLVWCA